MSVKYKMPHSGRHVLMEEWVNCALESTEYHGELETIAATGDHTKCALSRLLCVLHEKGLLTVDEVSKIAHEYHRMTPVGSE